MLFLLSSAACAMSARTSSSMAEGIPIALPEFDRPERMV